MAEVEAVGTAETVLRTPPSSPGREAATARAELKTPAGAPLDHLPPTPLSPADVDATPCAPPFPESATLDRNKLRARLNKKIKGGNCACELSRAVLRLQI